MKQILHPSLHGYRNNRSTLTALLQMYEKWAHSASEGKVSGAIFLDLSAAFDLVPPDILQKKLQICGLQESFLQWMNSYVTGRHQAVWIDHCYSNYLPCEVWVPQGSILGPLIFLIFINDLCQALPSDLKAFLFADDITIWTAQSTWDAVEQALNDGFSHLNQKAEESRMEFRREKCAIMTIGIDEKPLNVHGNTLYRWVVSETRVYTLVYK